MPIEKKDNSEFPDDPFDTFADDSFPPDSVDGFPSGFSIPEDNNKTVDNEAALRKKIEGNIKETEELIRIRQEAVLKKYGLAQYSIMVGASNFFSGAVVGGVLGAVNGAIEGRQIGLSMSTGYGGHIVRSSLANAGSFGGFLGAYTGIKCYMKHSRKKSDLFNSFTAGTVAGMIGSLRTRSPSTILMSGIGSGILMAGIDSFSPQHN